VTKILTLKTLKKKIQSHHRQSQKIAFTNGCFDILHVGHVSYLQTAKKNNRILIVGLNSDASVRKIKGKHRPLNSQRDRATVLSALECIDYITIFNEETPLNLIKALKPDVLIKGADWKGKVVVGGEFVKSCGGKVEHIKYLTKFSTTKMIQRVLNTYDS